ncbi:ATP-binding protein [Neobacillus sp. WH10]|uniref:ATP-binding protein n=1 Tax=Neobacillus sp. WH10 TaxID=3047873 RepID=UPI0024C1E7F1|nr:ATP-binding protein [Neobacillus sp. WH10]WHY79680.1 ATP-binding protein [Neobacillus sp. WH10]
MRDIITIPFNGEVSLILSCDNSGAIGMKAQDTVHVPYETVAYYSLRVAVMECIAAGGKPISIVLHNFCGNGPWEELLRGIKKGLLELGLKDVPITGSTESNFPLLQSAVGLIVLGIKPNGKITDFMFSDKLKFAVIGSPLVGNEVLDQSDDIVPLSIFQEINKANDVMILPVGSKGILFELNQMFANEKFTRDMVITNLDILKSSGPSTCFIAVYHTEQEEELIRIAGGFFHSIQIERK